MCSGQLCTNNYLSIDGRLLLHECATIIHTPSRRHARMYFPRSATDVPLDRRIAAVYRPNSIAKSPAYSTRVVSMRNLRNPRRDRSEARLQSLSAQTVPGSRIGGIRIASGANIAAS